MFLQAIQIICSIFLIVALGMLLAHLGWLNKPAADLLAKLVTQVALPCTTISQLFTQYDRTSLLSAMPYLAMSFVSVLLLYALAYPVSALCRIPAGRRGIFRCLFACGNVIFIGLPVTTALLGDEALPAVLMYYLANTSIFYSLALHGVQTDSGMAGEGFSFQSLRRILNVPLVTFLLCTVLILLGFRMPGLVLDSARYIGGMVTPLSLFFIGSILYGMVRTGLTWQRGFSALSLAHFVLSPLMILLVSTLMGGLPVLWRNAYIIQASMPCQSSSAIIAYTYGADHEYATGAVMLTTLMCIATLPLTALVLTIL